MKPAVPYFVELVDDDGEGCLLLLAGEHDEGEEWNHVEDVER